jgi:hypothetical protein
MKELTFNIECSPSIHLKNDDMKIKIKKSDHDKKIEDARQYIKKLIILVNKNHLPMIFFAVDFGKFPKTNFWHLIYKLKHDEKCPYVTLRIISKK